MLSTCEFLHFKGAANRTEWRVVNAEEVTALEAGGHASWVVSGTIHGELKLWRLGCPQQLDCHPSMERTAITVFAFLEPSMVRLIEAWIFCLRCSFFRRSPRRNACMYAQKAPGIPFMVANIYFLEYHGLGCCLIRQYAAWQRWLPTSHGLYRKVCSWTCSGKLRNGMRGRTHHSCIDYHAQWQRLGEQPASWVL